MSATSDELMIIARGAAERLDLPKDSRRFPSFGDIEDQCEDAYEDLLDALHDDEVFEPADVTRQEQLVEALQAALGEDTRALLEELIDNHTRHLWLHQEAAFHLGMAIGMRIANGRRH